MDFSDFLAELNIRIGDSDNFTFTPEEKTSALTEALNDEYVVKPKWDTTLTFSTGTYQYAKPSGVDVVQDIYIKADNSQDYPEKISSGLWEVVGSYIQFKPGADVIPSGYRLYLKSKTKYTTSDTITETNLKEYVLTAAQVRCYKTLLNKKNLRFLKNDTSVAEIVTSKRDLEQDLARYRQRLPKQFELA